MCDAEGVEPHCGLLDLRPGAEREADVVEPDPILIEAVARRRDRPEAEQPVAELVDHATVEKAKCRPRGLVGIGRHLEGDGEPEHVVVEGP